MAISAVAPSVDASKKDESYQAITFYEFDRSARLQCKLSEKYW